MKLVQNASLVDRFVDNLARRISISAGREIHVSDLVLCLRRAYYQKKEPKKPTPQTLGYFVDGSRRDIIIKGLIGRRVEPMVKNGIWFTPDSIDGNGEPIEIKTTRASNGVATHYITQLKYYMALLGKDRGHLLIQRIGFPRNTSPFEAFDLVFEDGEKARFLEEMMRRRDDLKASLDSSNPVLAPHMKNSADYKWLCENCPWRKECYDIPD